MCRLWRAIIFSTPASRRIFFLEAEPSPSALTDAPRRRRSHNNPLLYQQFYHFYDHEHGILEPQCLSNAFLVPEPRASVSLKRRAAVLRGEASWRDMLIHQPPTRVAVYRVIEGRNVDSASRCERASPTGLRMGELYDMAVTLLELRPSSDVSVDGVWSCSIGEVEGEAGKGETREHTLRMSSFFQEKVDSDDYLRVSIMMCHGQALAMAVFRRAAIA